MRNSYLVAIAAYPGMRSVIEECCAFMGIQPIIIDWEFANQGLINLLQDRFSIEGEPTVIISRGASANIIRKNFPNTVVIRAEPDDTDILEAMEQAALYGNRIGLLLHSSVSRNYKLDTFRRILNLKELRVYVFDTGEDIRKQIAEGKADGMQAMVGGGTLGERTGREFGIPLFSAGTGLRAMDRALQQAMSIINFHQKSHLQLETFRTTTALVSEGVMILENDRIILANQEMLHILEEDEEMVVNHKIDELCHDIPEKQSLEFFSDSYANESVLMLRGKSYVVRKKRNMDARLTVVFRSVEEIQQQEQHIRTMLKSKGMNARFSFSDIIGKSERIRATKEKAIFYATTDANIMIFGESGTGKELFAQSIHNASTRRLKPFVPVNCAAIPETLLESELFGYEDGAFSGAKRGGHRGLFETAQGGTLFLDEIDSVPVRLQGALLRAVQEKEIRRVGSHQILSVDVRIISATNRNIKKMITEGSFREDLYYRLNILNIQIPSLRERREDIIPLAEQFLRQYGNNYQQLSPTLTEEDKTALLKEDWRGNVRALANVIHRFTILKSKQSISIRDCLTEQMQDFGDELLPDQCLPIQPKHTEKDETVVALSSLENMEAELIRVCLARNHENHTITAAQLGISRATLWKKLKLINMEKS